MTNKKLPYSEKGIPVGYGSYVVSRVEEYLIQRKPVYRHPRAQPKMPVYNHLPV